MTLDDKYLIILGAFDNPRYGISPTAQRGSVESYSKKHGLHGVEYTEAVEAAVAAGFVAYTSDSALSIRNAGRNKLARR